jgi:predicted RNase H-like HicB family nuclease
VRLKVVIHPEPEGGFSAAVPSLPGCYSQGDTLEEALANAREAATAWLEAGSERQPFGPEEKDRQDLVQEIDL